MTRWVVRGRYCPTDCNPEQDAGDEIELGCNTREEVEQALLHLVDAEITQHEEER